MFFAHIKHQLQFIHPIRTSRGTMETHDAFYVFCFHDKSTFDAIENTQDIAYINHLIHASNGVGEAAPLKGLSCDEIYVKQVLASLCQQLNERNEININEYSDFPSVAFAYDTLCADIKFGSQGKIFDSSFAQGKSTIAINGLVWMDEMQEMENEALDKISKGYSTIKFKVGQHDFDEECRLLERIRKVYNSWKLDIRLDANGAFQNDDALAMLKELSRFDIHSIEQPVKAGQWELMERLCRESKIAIAFDEELIGINVWNDGSKLLQNLKPAYIIIKPTLLGSFAACNEWVHLCEKNSIKWWATSALESNIGLNSIAQWVSTKNNSLPQGLGTGLLYKNNVNTRLRLNGPNLCILN